jgi:UDP-glucose:glycoprotein glucosyltransferase
MYPGSLPQVKLNLFNMIVTVDLSKKADVLLVVEQLLMFIERRVAIRMGFVPITNTPEARAQAQLFYYFRDTYGIPAALRYISMVMSLRHCNRNSANKSSGYGEGRFWTE